jgi:hypothetical protein
LIGSGTVCLNQLINHDPIELHVEQQLVHGDQLEPSVTTSRNVQLDVLLYQGAAAPEQGIRNAHRSKPPPLPCHPSPGRNQAWG